MGQGSFIFLQNNLEARTCVLSYMRRGTGNTASEQAAGDREYQVHSILRAVVGSMALHAMARTARQGPTAGA